MRLRFEAVAEAEPGDKWCGLFERHWAAYKSWFLSEGNAARPSYRTRPMLLIFLLAAFLSNVFLLLNLLMLSFGSWFWTALIIKFLLEGLVMGIGANKFQQMRVLHLFPLWFILQPVYIPVVALGGMLIKHVWKP